MVPVSRRRSTGFLRPKGGAHDARRDRCTARRMASATGENRHHVPHSSGSPRTSVRIGPVAERASVKRRAESGALGQLWGSSPKTTWGPGCPVDPPVVSRVTIAAVLPPRSTPKDAMKAPWPSNADVLSGWTPAASAYQSW